MQDVDKSFVQQRSQLINDTEETDSIIAEEEDDMQTFRVTDGYQHSQPGGQIPPTLPQGKSSHNYESFGHKHKVQGYERFDKTVQSKLYFMKDYTKSQNKNINAFNNNNTLSLRHRSISPSLSSQHNSSTEDKTSLRKFTDPNLLFQHRGRKAEVQKAKQVLVDQALGRDTRNLNHLGGTKLQTNDQVLNSIEDYKQELQKKARRSIIQMYQKQPEDQRAFDHRSHSVMQTATDNASSPYLIETGSLSGQQTLGHNISSNIGGGTRKNMSSSKMMLKGNARSITQNALRFPPVRSSVNQASSLRTSSSGDALPAISQHHQSLQNQQRKKQSTIMMQQRKKSDVSQNPFLDNYFLRPSRISRFVEQTLRMSKKQPMTQNRRSSVNRTSLQVDHRRHHDSSSISIITQQHEDSLMDESLVKNINNPRQQSQQQNGDLVTRLAPHERYHSIEVVKSTDLRLLNERSRDQMTPVDGGKTSTTLNQTKKEDPVSKQVGNENENPDDLRISLNSQAKVVNPLYTNNTIRTVDNGQRQAIMQKRFEFPANNRPQQNSASVFEGSAQMPSSQAGYSSSVAVHEIVAKLPAPPVTAYQDKVRNQTGSGLMSSAGHSNYSQGSPDESRQSMSQKMHQSLRQRQQLIKEMYQSGSSFQQIIHQDKELQLTKKLIKGRKVVLKEKQHQKSNSLRQAYQTQVQLKQLKNNAGGGREKTQPNDEEDVLNRSIRVANLNNSQDKQNSRNNSQIETDTVFGLNIQGSAGGGNPYSMRSTIDKKNQQAFHTLTSADLIENGMILNENSQQILPVNLQKSENLIKSTSSVDALALANQVQSEVVEQLPTLKNAILSKAITLDKIQEDEVKNYEEQFQQMSSELIDIMSAQNDQQQKLTSNEEDNMAALGGDDYLLKQLTSSRDGSLMENSSGMMAALLQPNEYGDQNQIKKMKTLAKKRGKDSVTISQQQQQQQQQQLRTQAQKNRQIFEQSKSSHIKQRKQLLTQGNEKNDLYTPPPDTRMGQLTHGDEIIDQIQTLPITTSQTQIEGKKDDFKSCKSTNLVENYEAILHEETKLSPREFSHDDQSKESSQQLQMQQQFASQTDQDPYQIIQQQAKLVAMHQQSATKKKIIHLTQNTVIAKHTRPIPSENSGDNYDSKYEIASREGLNTDPTDSAQKSVAMVDGSVQMQTEQTDQEIRGDSHRIVLKSQAQSAQRINLPTDSRNNGHSREMSLIDAQGYEDLLLMQPVQQMHGRQSRYHSIESDERENNYESLLIEQQASPKSPVDKSSQQHKVLISVRKSENKSSKRDHSSGSKHIKKYSVEGSGENQKLLQLNEKLMPLKSQIKTNNHNRQFFQKVRKSQNNDDIKIQAGAQEKVDQMSMVKYNSVVTQGKKPLPKAHQFVKKPLMNQKFKKYGVTQEQNAVEPAHQSKFNHSKSFQSTLYDIRGITMKLNSTSRVVESRESSQQTDFEDDVEDSPVNHAAKVSAYDDNKAFPQRSTFMTRKSKAYITNRQKRSSVDGALKFGHPDRSQSDENPRLMQNDANFQQKQPQNNLCLNQQVLTIPSYGRQTHGQLASFKVVQQDLSRQTLNLKVASSSSIERNGLITSGQIVIPERTQESQGSTVKHLPNETAYQSEVLHTNESNDNSSTLKKSNPKLRQLNNFGVRNWEHTNQSDGLNEDLIREMAQQEDSENGASLNNAAQQAQRKTHLGQTSTTPYQQSLLNLYSDKNPSARINEKQVMQQTASQIPRNRSDLTFERQRASFDNDQPASQVNSMDARAAESLRNPPKIDSQSYNKMQNQQNYQQSKDDLQQKRSDKSLIQGGHQQLLRQSSSSQHDHAISINDNAGNETAPIHSMVTSVIGVNELTSLQNNDSLKNLQNHQVIAEDRIHIYSKFEHSGVVMSRPIPMHTRKTDHVSDQNITRTTANNNFGVTSDMQQLISIEAGQNMGYIETEDSILMAALVEDPTMQTEASRQEKIKTKKIGNIVYTGAARQEVEAGRAVKDSSMSRYSMRQKSIMMVKNKVKNQIKRGF